MSSHCTVYTCPTTIPSFSIKNDRDLHAALISTPIVFSEFDQCVSAAFELVSFLVPSMDNNHESIEYCKKINVPFDDDDLA